MFASNGLSLSDIAAVTRNDQNDGFGGGNGWWILIILFALFGGWGNNGYGNNGNAGGALTRADLCQDMNFQGLENGIRGIQQGLCDGFYSQNSTMLQGFNGLQNSLCGEFRTVDNAICNLGYSVQQGFNDSNVVALQNANAIQSQLANCCCENRQAIAQVRYDMATDTCAIQNAIQQQTQAIIQNDNNNYRQIHDELVAIQMNNKDERIAELTAKLNQCNLESSQAAQNSYLISQLRPFPSPTYNVPNPFAGTCSCYSNCGCGGCGCN